MRLFVADLITHGAVAVLVKASSRGAMPAVFVLGTVMPDLCARVPAIGLGYIHVHLMELPAWMTYGWQPLHQPVGMALMAYLTAMVFVQSQRAAVFWNVIAGMALHLFVDSLQNHHGAGYLLGFPFWEGTFEFALMGSEATVWWAVPLALVAWGTARYRYRSG